MKLSRRERQALEAIHALYARLPDVHCQRKCSVACGPIVLCDLEARALQQAGGVKPRTIPIARADGSPSERCVYLSERGACRAYQARPLICRVWGVVRMLSCMHGCVPDRWLDDYDFAKLAQAIERLGGGRTLMTTPDGLALIADGFCSLPKPTRSAEARLADAERTRSLRAIFGGRIIAAVDSSRE